MSLPDLQDSLAEVPRSIQDEVYGYVDSIEEKLDIIAAEENIDLSPEQRNLTLFLVGLWRFYGIIAGQFRTLDYCLSALNRHNLPMLQLGSTSLFRGSLEYEETSQLQQDLRRILHEEDLAIAYVATTINDIVRWVNGQ